MTCSKRRGFVALVQRAFGGETVRVPPHWYDPRELRQLGVQKGRRVGVEATLFPLRDAAGELQHIALCFRDVTAELKLRSTAAALEVEIGERKQVERALRASEESLATRLNSIGDAVIASDTNGCVTRMNPVAEVLTGWPLEEARGKPPGEVFQIINEDTKEPVESPVNRVLREGVVVGLANHTVLVVRDGTTRAIADSGAPIRDDHGALRGVVLVFRDQTDARNAERALHDSEARKAAILESALDCIVTLDHAGLITEFDPSAEITFGYSRATALGRPPGRSAHWGGQVPASVDGWHTWTFWQFTNKATVSGIPGTAETDENQFNGSLAELRAYSTETTRLRSATARGCDQVLAPA